MLKLSIITINLNNSSGLIETINSVSSQTFRDFEYVIVDGSSNDGSIEVIKQNSQHINKWISEPDTGIYNAMNKGIILSEGEYCFFLNSGDTYYKDDVLSEIFNHSLSESFIQGSVMACSKTNKNQRKLSSISNSDITFADLFLTSLYHQASFIKRELFQKYGLYDERYKTIADRVFTIKTLGLNNVSFKYMDIIVSNYNIDGISGNQMDYYHSETIPALKELIPARILSDYQSGYFEYVKRMKKYRITWFLFRILNYLTITIEQKSGTR